MIFTSRAVLLGMVALGLILLAQPFAPPAGDAAKSGRVARMARDIDREFPDVPVMSAADFLAARAADPGLAVVDAREPAERAVSVIPGAVAEADFLAAAGGARGKTVVVYCTIGYRSAKLARAMAARGAFAFNLDGGILAYVHAGGELAGPDGKPTRRLHVYGREWDLAPAGFETVW